MKKSDVLVVSTSVACLVGIAAWLVWPGAEAGSAKRSMEGPGTITVEVLVPELSETAKIGARIFNTACAACHGENAAGQDGVAPPLIHKIYEPGHHADEAFQRAAALGVRAHHWPFGDMPPIDGVTRAEVAMLIRYIREVQEANGIR